MVHTVDGLIAGPAASRLAPAARRAAADAVIVIVVVFTACVEAGMGGTRLAVVPASLVVALACGIVLLRVRYPRASLGAAILAAIAGMLAGASIVSLVFAVLVCVFSVARRTDRRTTTIFALAAIVPITGASLLLLSPNSLDIRATIQFALFIGFAAAAGDATRSRRAFIDAITERARIAEETKESEALRRVAEERLRIARDLHDLLAHQIAVINLHPNVAAQALRERPDDAERSLATIRQAARTVLGEIGSLLTVLRAGDPDAGGTAAAPAVSAPAAGLDELDALVAGFRQSGLAVEVRVEGTPSPVPEQAGLVGYQVIQEALTNAHKHGGDRSALLHLEFPHAGDIPGILHITVTNTVPAAALAPGRTDGTAAPGARTVGYGLLGARERVASVGGTLDTGTGPGPVFRFTAHLPVGPAGAPTPPDNPCRRPATPANTTEGSA